MPASQFYAFAAGVGANVLSPASFSSASWRTTGFTAGIAPSQHLNTVWRQSSVMTAAWAQAIVDLTSSDVNDDGNVTSLTSKIKSAIAAGAGGVSSFNTRTGAITLTLTDINAAMTGQLLLNADPTSALGAATKQYVDGVATGLKLKDSVACATTPLGGNITLSGEQTIDGVLTSNSRVLVKDQSSPAQNGLYVSAAGAWTRATDMDTWAEVPSAFTFVTAGTTNGNTGWSCSSVAGGTLGTTAITWTQFSAAGAYTAGTGLTLSGNTFALANMAEARVKGRAAGAGTGAPTDLTGTQLAAIVDVMVGDSGSGGAAGLAPAPPSGSAAAKKYLGADGTYSNPQGDFVSFAGRSSNGACSVNVQRGFGGGVNRTASGAYDCLFDADIGTVAYGVTITTGQQNCVASYSKQTDRISIAIQQGNANVGTSPQNPADVTVVIHR